MPRTGCLLTPNTQLCLEHHVGTKLVVSAMARLAQAYIWAAIITWMARSCGLPQSLPLHITDWQKCTASGRVLMYKQSMPFPYPLSWKSWDLLWGHLKSLHIKHTQNEMADLIKDEIDIEIHSVKFYTDSKIVLGYINNTRRQFYVYVSNRITTIRISSQPSQWYHINTEDNPADHGTRPVTESALKDTDWFSGPSSLFKLE